MIINSQYLHTLPSRLLFKRYKVGRISGAPYHKRYQNKGSAALVLTLCLKVSVINQFPIRPTLP